MVYRPLSFDPADNPVDNQIETLRIDQHIRALVTLMESVSDRGEQAQRIAAVAIEKLQTAAMWCVLAATTKALP